MMKLPNHSERDIKTKMSSPKSTTPPTPFKLLMCHQTYVVGQRAFMRLTKLET